MSYAFTQRPRRGGYSRLLVWCEGLGHTVLDVAGRHLGAVHPGEPSESLLQAASGRRYPESFERTFAADLIRGSDAAEYGRIRRLAYENGYSVQAALLGTGGAHVLWLEEATAAGLSAPRGFGGFAVAGVRLNTAAFYAAISDGPDLLAFAPWHCTSAEDLDLTHGAGPFYLQGPAEYDGPRWVVDGEDDEVDAAGAATLASDAVLTFPFPAVGAVVRLHVTGGTGTVKALSTSGATIETKDDDEDLTLPAGTWGLEVTVTGAITEAPALEVVRP